MQAERLLRTSAFGFGFRFGKTFRKQQCVFFRDCALKYFFKNGTGKLPAELIAAKSVVMMKEWDIGRSVKYCESLKIYLEENMNATNAAKRLSIQRNTFLARLERIQKLLEVNLDDPTERLYVLISLMILDI